MVFALAIGALLAVTGALVGLIIEPGFVASLVCTAPENLPCRPLTLQCLVDAAGGLGVIWPAIQPEPPYQPQSDQPDRSPRPYAPEPPPGYQPPPPPSPQDALSDPRFYQAREDWARENAGRFPTTTEGGQSAGSGAFDTLVQSIRNQGTRR